MSDTKEIKITMADPTALGVFGLALITLAASSSKLGLTTGSTYLMPWALCLGSAAQIWAAKADFKRNNYFGAIVLGTFGLFWVAVALVWALQNGIFGGLPENADLRQFGWACFAYAIFSIFFTIAAWEANKVFGAILTLIVVLLGALGAQLVWQKEYADFGAAMGKVAGVAELGVAILGLYAAGALFLNSFFGRTMLPLGKPMGWIKKSV